MSFQETSRSVLIISLLLLLVTQLCPSSAAHKNFTNHYKSSKKKCVNQTMLDITQRGERGANIVKTEEQQQPRIIGGSFHRIEEHPYMAAIIKDKIFSCGGTLISTFHVLSAAHCIYEDRGSERVQTIPPRLRVRLGSTYNNQGGKVYKVSWVFVHPLYLKYDYDCTVLELAKEVQLSEHVALVNFATRDDTETLERLVVTHSGCVTLGWGSIEPRRKDVRSPHFKFLPYLQGLYMRLIPWTTCFQQAFIDKEKELCTNIEGAKGSCQGDSGGPLICSGKQYGIVSWGVGCGRREEPDIFARVDAMSDFIDRAMSEKGLYKYRRSSNSNRCNWMPTTWCFIISVTLLSL